MGHQRTSTPTTHGTRNTKHNTHTHHTYMHTHMQKHKQALARHELMYPIGLPLHPIVVVMHLLRQFVHQQSNDITYHGTKYETKSLSYNTTPHNINTVFSFPMLLVVVFHLVFV